MIINADWIRENYLKYNQIAFGGKLPTDIKFSASKRLKNSAGYASYIMHRDSGTISDIGLTIASSFDNNEDAFLCTLLHEMIHIWQYIIGYKGGHGTSFKKKANEINKFGWGITTKYEELAL